MPYLNDTTDFHVHDDKSHFSIDKCECWTIKVQCEEHNHEPAFHIGAHPYAAQLSANEAELVADLSVNRVKPRDILTTLKNQNSNNVSTLKTIYNACNKARMTEKADLFFAHPISLDIWRAFPHVVLMDATYSTNQYKMPLLEIVGVTSTNMTFCIVFIYVSNERESSYAWALDCLKLTMNGCICPRVIVTNRELSLIKACHNMQNNALQMAHLWKHFKKKQKEDIWELFSKFFLSSSLTEEEYFNNLRELQRILEDYQGVLKYVNDTWLNPFKEMFVSVWTDKYLHFGNHTTNRVESLNYIWIHHNQISNHHVHQMIKAQETHIKASFEKSRTVTKHRYKIQQFNELRGFVSIHALDLIYKELERCDNVGVFSENCGCRLCTSHGLPCAHEQSLNYSQSRLIPLDSIDVFWRKLDFTPCIALHDDDISCEEEVQRFTDMFRKQSQPNKVHLLRRLKEILVPSTISMLEPAKTRRGPPSLKDKLSRSFRFISSTQEPPRRSYCEKSEFDGAYTLRYQAPARHSSYVSGYQAPTPNIDNNIEFLDQFEPIFHPYIMQVQDVKPDGNCAFRAISVCLGFDEDNWPNIRRELLEELNMYRT
ncbi:LOW QUALITY PROTEIN: hypothetical protein OSB04_016827 [Centaurea solstitialis]|uniref:OTU domain-containing protein n=1 Tax=Centaurea solstitialis TaxID=347529 RepID=A0AA38WA59_9ASTR|nr:LOW QUALITY PROTEIN: hypothetical protein OSB04_016827 [Centaurea solstitialis]